MHIIICTENQETETQHKSILLIDFLSSTQTRAVPLEPRIFFFLFKIFLQGPLSHLSQTEKL